MYNTTKALCLSMEKTMPLNRDLNAGFGKVYQPDANPRELLAQVVPQMKLVLDELEETILTIDIRETLDGIGDVITTADGLLVFAGFDETGGLDGQVNELYSPENTGVFWPWSLSGLEAYNDTADPDNALQTLNDLMFADFSESSAVYMAAKNVLVFDSKYRQKVSDPDAHRKMTSTFEGSGYICTHGKGFDCYAEMLVAEAIDIRNKIDIYAKYLGYCPVKILEEVYKSNMSKFCDSYDDAVATIEKYKGLGLTALEIVQCDGLERWFVRTTEEVEFNGQLLPVGKFMKGVNFVGPDWSDLQRFELEPLV